MGSDAEGRQITARDVLKQWPVMLAVFLVIGFGLFGYVRSMPVNYVSNAVVAFQPQPGRSDGKDLISLLIQTYPEFVASEQTVNVAARAAGVDPSAVRAGLDAKIPPLTLNMLITTKLGDPRQAQVAAQSLVDQVIAQGKADPYLVASAISNASLSESPSGVSKKLLWMVSLIMALGAALVSGIVLARLRTAKGRVRTPAAEGGGARAQT